MDDDNLSKGITKICQFLKLVNFPFNKPYQYNVYTLRICALFTKYFACDCEFLAYQPYMCGSPKFGFVRDMTGWEKIGKTCTKLLFS